MSKRRIVILGVTGSIGQSALKVAQTLPDRVEIIGMSAHANGPGLAKASMTFPKARVVQSNSPDGPQKLIELVTMPEVELVLIAIVGTAGLPPALAAIEAGKDLAIASKEILVLAGEIVMTEAKRKGVRILPIDSEHNAIFQCLESRPPEHVNKLILTCSGGPFRTFPASDLDSVTPEMALKHPTWNMGRKITVDSATLFNKALEMIEARWLFDVGIDRIEVLIHPQSIVHSMVEFVDGSQLAQLSCSDMCFPIQYAITYPDRVVGSLAPLDLASLGRLDFETPRENVFPALQLAREAGAIGGTLPAVLNAANEIAVEAFLAGHIHFPKIWDLVAETMHAHSTTLRPDLHTLLNADRWAREFVGAMIKSQHRHPFNYSTAIKL